ncbi:hypothetical protein ABW19_dt0210626 [Dactylella cylindrospora]|nr:hypothetical protein ABW19_dt0210626 [Dactylella cylindrospora]
MEKKTEGQSSDRAQISMLSLAFASFILLNKPSELTATEFIYYLRGCIQNDQHSKSTSLQRISNDSYWRNLCDDKDLKILELDQKLIDANVENERLTELLKKRKNKDEIGTKGKRRKLGEVVKEVESNSKTPLVEWEPLKKTYENLSTGHPRILNSLRSLHYAEDSQSIAPCIVNLCKAIASTIREFCHRDRKESEPENKLKDCTRILSVRQTDATAIQRRLLDSAWVEDISNAIDEVFRRLFMGISRLSLIAEKDTKEPKVDLSRANATQAISDLICSIIDSIHSASQAFSRDEELPRTRDIRAGCIKTLQHFLVTLNGNNEFQASIVESAIYVIAEAAGKCLCVPVNPKPRNKEKEEQERKALKETSLHILELLKAIVPLYRDQLAKNAYQRNLASKEGVQNLHTENTVLELAKRKFHDYVMKGLFSDPSLPDWKDLKSYAEGNAATPPKQLWGGIGFQQDFIFVDEEGFADHVWELLELEDFALVW